MRNPLKNFNSAEHVFKCIDSYTQPIEKRCYERDDGMILRPIDQSMMIGYVEIVCLEEATSLYLRNVISQEAYKRYCELHV